MSPTVSNSRSLLPYFVLVFAFSTPFWVLGAVSSQRLSSNLSLGSLMAISPVAAALVLSFRDKGSVGAKALLRRAVDYRGLRAKAWYLPIFLLMPMTMVAEYAVLRVAGVSIPGPDIAVPEVLISFLFFFVAALFEEVGWSGYAIDRLQDRWSALTASVILGVVWGLWHLPAIIEMPAHHNPDWIAMQCANQVVTRILIVWIYNNTGKSVFAAILIHAVSNLSTLVLFPVNGSYYDPFVADALLTIVVAMVVFLWGPNTLARYRNAGASSRVSLADGGLEP